MVTAPHPPLALRRPQFHSLLYRWSCTKMADFLPSRSFLSVFFPNCLLNSSEAEQLRKSKEIDRGLLKDKTYVKRLVKILLLGAGESGKSTFLKQMRIIHGQDFDQRAKEEFRGTIYSNIMKGMRSVSHPHTYTKCHVGSKLDFNGHGRDERLAKWGLASVSWSCAVTCPGETPMLFSQLFSVAVLNKDLREGLDSCLNRFLACRLIESVISLALVITEVWKD